MNMPVYTVIWGGLDFLIMCFDCEFFGCVYGEKDRGDSNRNVRKLARDLTHVCDKIIGGGRPLFIIRTSSATANTICLAAKFVKVSGIAVVRPAVYATS